jgi:transcriptional regulator with GAF, ATPase, and Fis domain
MPTLVLDPAKSGPDVRNARAFTVAKKMTSIGSAPTNDVVIEGPDVEDSHAVLQFDGKNFVIQAVERKNAVYVNGRKKRKATLSEGDEIRIGDQTLRFSILHQRSERRKKDSTQHELYGFRRLHELSQALLGEYDLPVLLESLMDAVVDLTKADKGFLILTEGDELSIRVARNVDRENIEDAVEHVSDSIIAKVLESRDPIIVSDALNDAEFNSSQSVINLNLCSVMCVPLLDRGRMLGLIYVGNDNIANLFTRQHLDLLETFAGQASLIVANALMVNDLRLDNEELKDRLDEKRYGSIIGACTAMREVFRTVEKVAPTNVNVLVTGETGTGKELIANEIHARSPRSTGPFVTINCGAIPESLLESELFGHVKGAFTGATATRQGKFQAADGGTIFLDEIGEMPLNLQVKLLRVLQERTITKVGATQTEDVDIRVVAATNRDLDAAVKEGDFREDLFYRLNVVMLRLPPLRDRGNDVALIARYLIQKISTELNLEAKELSPDAITAMLKYSWPGNIRQLENRLKKAIVLADGPRLEPSDLELEDEDLTPVLPLAEAKERYAYRYIMEALERNGGNRTQTAKELGVDPRTIFRYLEKEF